MKKHNTSDRLKQIMSERNLKQVDILNLAAPFCKKYDVKLNKNDLSQYVSGKVEPGQNKLYILGLALNVNEAWLMGFDVPMDKQSTNSEFKSTIDMRKKKLINNYELLDDVGRQRLLDYSNDLVSSCNYMKDKQKEKHA